MLRSAAVLAAAIGALAAAVPAQAADWTVSGTGDAGGTCVVQTCTTVRAALASAAGDPGPDAVRLPAGNVVLAAGELKVDGEVTITGAGARATVITAAPSARVFNVAAGATATIAHLTMRGGRASDYGGNLYTEGTLTLDHVRVTAGFAARGTGVAAAGGALTIEHSLVDHNTSVDDAHTYSSGGAVMTVGTATAHIKTSTIAFNEGYFVGGVYVYAYGSTTGAGPALRLTAVTIAGNHAIYTGGLRVLGGETAVITRSIVAGNTASDAGKANCSTGTGRITSLGANAEGATDCGFSAPEDRQNVPLTPALAGRGGETDTVAIPAGSPAVDLGPPCADETDQRDLRRYQGSACDAGAYELDQPPDTTISNPASGTLNTRDLLARFSSSEPDSTFECELVAGAYLEVPRGRCQPVTAFTLHADRGLYTLRVTAIDAAGQRDPTPAVVTFTYVPGAPAVIFTRGPEGFTRDPSPAFEFTSSLPQSPFECRLDRPGPDGFMQMGAWEPCVSPALLDDLPGGFYRFLVRGFDDARNPGDLAIRSFEVDTVDPRTTLLSGPSGATAGASPSFSFSSNEPDSTFECRLDGPGPAAGSFAPCTSPRAYSDLADGSYRFLVRARDRAGNADASPPERAFTVDTAAPATPEITAPAGDVLQRSGAVAVEGRAEPDATVILYDNGIVRATTTGSVSHRWSAMLSGLNDGIHMLQARAKDAAGNLSGYSAGVTVRIDTSAPAAPVITSPAGDVAQSSGSIQVSGTAEAGAVIALLQNGVEVERGPADGSGHWSFGLERPDGTYALRARATDAAGNVSTPSATVIVQVDRVAPAPPRITAPANQALQATDTVTVEGTAEPHAEISVLAGSRHAGATTASGEGRWSVTATGLPDGAHALTAQATDAARNQSAWATPVTVRIDTQPPAAPVIAAPSGDAVQIRATFALTGSAEPGALVEVLEGDASRGTTTATADGGWSLTFAGVPDGDHHYRARATDAVGNTGPLSAPRTVHVDMRPAGPAEPALTPTPAPAPRPLTPSPSPSLHRSVVLTPLRGRTSLKPPGGATAPLERAQEAALGTIVDARAGMVRVTAVPRAGAPARTVVASGGRFAVTQKGAVTLLRLTACRGRVWADGGSGFATRSRHTTAQPRRSARWLISDDCRRTRVRVARGEVRVKQGRRTRTIRAPRP